LKGKDIVVASSSVFNIGVELKGMLDIQGYQYINPQISLFSDPNMQRLLFCPLYPDHFEIVPVSSFSN